MARIGSTTSTLDTRRVSSHPAWLIPHMSPVATLVAANIRVAWLYVNANLDSSNEVN